MSEVVVIGAFTAQPGKQEEALQAFQDLVQPTHDEPGCVLYALHQGVDNPAQLAFVERWASREELNAHLESPHVRAILGRAAELFGDSGTITVYDAVPHGEPTKGSIKVHAGG